MRRPSTCLEAALAYLDRDWAALAVCPPDHRGVPDFHRQTCRQPGKRPLGRWKAWQFLLPTLEEVAAQWEAVPQANVAVVLGTVSGLVGVDVDGPEGERILEEVSRGELPRTLALATGRGSRLLYAIPEDVTIPNRTFAGRGGEVKVLATGTLTVMPPSRHASGRRYRWLPRRGPAHLRPAPAPEWVWNGKVKVTGTAAPGPLKAGAPILEGQRNTRLFKVACALRRHGCTPPEILTLLRTVNARCEPPLAEDELRTIELSVARYPPI
jgi:Bifunctional DNA primase/polymerase, N-terminal/Primase C terminal 1 (PriCT-1)